MPGTGINVVPNKPKCSVLVLMLYLSYRRYESLYWYRRYQYLYRTEQTEVFGIGIDAVPNTPKCLVPALMSYGT